MNEFTLTVTAALVLLTAFLVFATGLKYGAQNKFARTRLLMTAFFLFIAASLTVSFWQYTFATLPFTIPAFFIGAFAGQFLGVRAARAKLRMQGAEHYMEHFAHVHVRDIASFSWWSIINFYSVMGGLALINLIGISVVLTRGSEVWAIGTSVFGAFLMGTIVPYLLHLWHLRARRRR